MDGNQNAKPEKKLQRKLFSIEEDAKLRFLVSQYGSKDFKKIASYMPGRTPRQVRERYKNYLSPEVNNGPWSREEDALLCQKFMELGPKWSKIADFFPSRSDINVKNRWTSIKGTQPYINVKSINNNTKPNINCNPIKNVQQQPMMTAYNHTMPMISNHPMMMSNMNNFPQTQFNPSFNHGFNPTFNNQFNSYNAYQSFYPSSNVYTNKTNQNVSQTETSSTQLDDLSDTKFAENCFCDTEEFERDDSNFMFSFDINLSAEQNTFIYDNDFVL